MEELNKSYQFAGYYCILDRIASKQKNSDLVISRAILISLY